MNHSGWRVLPIVCILLFSQCKNELIEPDILPNAPLIDFQDQSIEIGYGEVTILNIKNMVNISGDLTVRVTNAEEFVDRIYLTRDGWLAYKAPENPVDERIDLVIEDEFGNSADGKIDLEVAELSTINYCSDLDFVSVGNEVVFLSTDEITANDVECDGAPTGDFEIIFPPQEMVVNQDGDALAFQPNPGGIGLDVLVYRGNLTDPDSTYLDILLISNTVGCQEGGVWDFITLSFDPAVAIYKLDVMANDEFCTFEMTDAKLESVFGEEFGTIEIVDEQYLIYTPDPASTLPIQENFTYVATYPTLNGFVTQTVPVSLTINP